MKFENQATCGIAKAPGLNDVAQDIVEKLQKTYESIDIIKSKLFGVGNCVSGVNPSPSNLENFLIDAVGAIQLINVDLEYIISKL